MCVWPKKKKKSKDIHIWGIHRAAIARSIDGSQPHSWYLTNYSKLRLKGKNKGRRGSEYTIYSLWKQREGGFKHNDPKIQIFPLNFA